MELQLGYLLPSLPSSITKLRIALLRCLLSSVTELPSAASQRASFTAHFDVIQRLPVSMIAIIGGAVLWVGYALLVAERPYPGIPFADINEKGIRAVVKIFMPGLSWTLSPREVMAKGREISKHTDGIYQIRSSGGYKIVLPSKYAEDIKNSDYMTLSGSMRKDFHVTRRGFEAMHDVVREDNLLMDVIARMTQNLTALMPAMVEETSFSVAQRFEDDEKEWQTCEAKKVLTDMIACITARSFAGIELARNKDWIRISRDHAISTFISAKILHLVPPFLRDTLIFILPTCRTQRKQITDATLLLAPRVREIERAIENGIEQPRTPDVFTWLVELSNGRPINFVLSQLGLAEASIHTASELLTRVMIQCCKFPEFIPDLRDEMVHVLKEEGGWSRTALFKMKLLDSFIKEVSWTCPMGIAGMLRDIQQDVKLSNGFVLPKGGYAMVEDDYTVNHGFTVHPIPGNFDPYRHYRLRQQPGHESRHQIVNTSAENFVFGYGRHQCPGRQFSSNEMKVLLTFLLLKYDWRIEPGYTVPEPIIIESRVAAPDVRLQYRRRREEIDLMKVKMEKLKDGL